MKISIITICLNSALRIERCVQSILAQTNPPNECIFVDGGSTDGTLELLEKLRKQLEASNITVKILNQERKPGEAGIPSAWNQGIAVATGDVIALLNSDDYYNPDTLAFVNDNFTAEKDILAASINLVDGNGNKTGEIHPKCQCLHQILMSLPHPACFIKKSLYDRIGTYNTKYRISADYEFIWRCMRNNASFLYSDELLTNMETGGAANSSRKLARNETLEIGMHYSRFKLLPYLAWLIRSITGK